MLLLLTLITTLTVAWLFERLLSLQRNVRAARDVGLPYIVVPVYTATPTWYFCYRFVLPLLRKLPNRCTDPWLEYKGGFYKV